jgi:hypothetical protein
MNAEPLNKDIYNKALALGIEKITLRFSGGSDEGCLDVDLTPWNEKTTKFIVDIENWVWDVYSYSGAGDGSDYGDDITYDLKNKRVSTSEWYTSRSYVNGDPGDLTVADEDEE